MKDDIVPDSDHVSRLCGGSHIREDGTISATAFKPRPGEPYLSVNWLEQLGLAQRSAEITEIRRVLGTKRGVGGTAMLAILVVGEARAVVIRDSHGQKMLVVRHEPETGPSRPDDPSHSGIHGVPDDDNTIPELFARVVRETYKAR